MNTLKIQTKSVAERTIVLDLLVRYGFKWHGQIDDVQVVDTDYHTAGIPF